MNDSLRTRLYDLYAAFAAGRIDDALQLFDDNVTMTSYAPIEVFPALGRRQGRAAVAANMHTMHGDFKHFSYTPVFMVTEAEAAAVIVLARPRQRATDRIMQLFVAHFLRLQGGRTSSCANSWIPSTPCSRCSGARFSGRRHRRLAGEHGREYKPAGKTKLWNWQ